MNEMKSKILRKQLCNNKITTVLGMPLTNANGAIDPSTTGYDYVIQTTSEIRARIIEQKFYKVPISDYLPMDVGEAAWKTEIVQNISYDLAGSFYQGDVDTLQGNGKIAEVNTATAPIRIPTIIWAKGVSWNVSEVAQAAASSNWDVVERKMKSLKRNWDLGIQETAFLGHPSIIAVSGLLNNSEVNINTSIIDKPLSDMTETEYTVFVKAILNAYFVNSNSTDLPDVFIMPTDDYLGMGVPYSPAFPTISKLEYLLNNFKKMTQNPDFQILPLAYAQDTINISRGINKNRYVLYRNDPETLSMSIPVDFSMYEAGTANNIFWQQPAMGQYSGVLINRVPEVLYLDETP
jgi:hypothetical protein